MINLLSFLISKITGAEQDKDFSVTESQEEDRTMLMVNAKPDFIGLIIGKEGKTIKNIRKIIAIRGVLENKSVNISVTEI